MILANRLVKLLSIARQMNAGALFPPLLPMKEIVNSCIFGSFFNYQQIFMSGFLTEYLVECHRGDGVLVFNIKKVKLGLKDAHLYQA